MASKKMNVLVYNGPGTTVNSLQHTFFTLRRLLTPNYAVLPISPSSLLNEPWTATCALLVMPGGADLPYCQALNGQGNVRIRNFVDRGGRYLGLCAGGYYGSARCEFEVGRKAMEVLGDRELAFFPGTCRGTAYEGFEYQSEKGARAAEIIVSGSDMDDVQPKLRVYYNGGGVFVDASKYKNKGVEVLAHFGAGKLVVDPGLGEDPAAVVYCKVGKGGAVLTSPHPEFSASNLDPTAEPDFPRTVQTLRDDDMPRLDFMKACLKKLGLHISEDKHAVPSLTTLHLSSLNSADTEQLLEDLEELESEENGETFVKDESDKFKIVHSSTLSVKDLKDFLPNHAESLDGAVDNGGSEDKIVDYHAVVKELVIHEDGYPGSHITPQFNHRTYFDSLIKYYGKSHGEANPAFGRTLLYGEVVTSTNTMLEKNTKLLQKLPHGFTFAATVQVEGRGRGSNVWISPAGSLMFSTVIRHEAQLQRKAPVVFVQYLAAMAVVQAVRTYDGGYDDIEIRLKWPNDIYAIDPKASKSATGPNRYTKIGGILVNSHYSSTTYHAVLGLGLNLSNSLPTTSLNNLLAHNYPHLQPFVTERLLARIISCFSEIYTRFRRTGFDEYLEDKYYAAWLHTGQIVNLEMEAGKRVRIVGITPDWGLLVGEEVDDEGRGLGRKVELQSDSNSFDFFKGLIRRKI